MRKDRGDPNGLTSVITVLGVEQVDNNNSNNNNNDITNKILGLLMAALIEVGLGLLLLLGKTF